MIILDGGLQSYICIITLEPSGRPRAVIDHITCHFRGPYRSSGELQCHTENCNAELGQAHFAPLRHPVKGVMRLEGYFYGQIFKHVLKNAILSLSVTVSLENLKIK